MINKPKGASTKEAGTLESGRSSFREDLVEQTKHLGHVELHVLKVEKMLVVFLLWVELSQNEAYGASMQRTFSRRSSMLRSISRIAFSRPL